MLSYEPPAGKIGAAVAKLLGEEPSKQVAEDLRRFKQVMDAGEADRAPARPAELARQVTYDCIVVGAGPAGLSAALMLGRCRRSVLVCDAGEPRNARVGRAPRLSHPGRHSLPLSSSGWRGRRSSEYPTVEFHRSRSRRRQARTAVDSPSSAPIGTELETRKLLLATGVVDELPDIDGLEAALRHQRPPLPLLRRVGVAGSAACGLWTGRGRRRAGAGAHRVE